MAQHYYLDPDYLNSGVQVWNPWDPSKAPSAAPLTGALAGNPYGNNPQQSWYEREADVMPVGYISNLDDNGNLKAPYKNDPSQSAAFRQMEQMSSSGDLSPWAKLQMQQNDLSTAHQRDQSNAQGLGATSQAMQQLMSTGGGGSSGAAAFLANQGARSNALANQNIGAQSQASALGIQQSDAQNMQKILGQVADTQTQAQAQNTGTAIQDTQNANAYNANRYGQIMGAWGAEQTANAQRSAASSSGGGCCFIFLEARYGDGTMDQVVRKFRDEHMTDQNKRGYYKLSEVLVPLMRKSRVVKFLVRALMTDPLVSFGKYHYTGKGMGRIFKPVKDFWLKAFNYLGQDHKFIRENGEVI